MNTEIASFAAIMCCHQGYFPTPGAVKGYNHQSHEDFVHPPPSRHSEDTVVRCFICFFAFAPISGDLQDHHHGELVN